MASTLTWSKLKEGTHPGYQPPLKTKPGFDQSPSRPGQNRGHQWRWRTGPETPGPCTGPQKGTKYCHCRGSPPRRPAASAGGGPHRSEACSPGGGSTAPLPPSGPFQGRCTRRCARHACTGCNRRQTAHRPHGSRRPLLRRHKTKQPLAWKPVKGPRQRLARYKRPALYCDWLSKAHARTCVSSTAD